MRRKKIREHTETLIACETREEGELRRKEKKEHTKTMRCEAINRGTAVTRLKMFRDKVRWGPIYPCIICHQTLFGYQVVEFNMELQDLILEKCPEEFRMKLEELLVIPSEKFKHTVEEGRSFDYEHRMKYKKTGIQVPDQITITCGGDQTFLCKVCCDHLKKGKLPPKAVSNCLDVLPIPESVSLKSYLEEALIARVLLFIKIFSLKSSLNEINISY